MYVRKREASGQTLCYSHYRFHTGLRRYWKFLFALISWKRLTPAATLIMNAMTDYVRPRLLAVKEVGTSSEDGQKLPPFTIFFLFLKGRVFGLLKRVHVFPSSWRSKHPVIPESHRHPQQFLYLGSRNNNSFHNGDNSRQLQKIEEEKHGVGMGGGRESIDFTCVVQHKGLHNLDPFLPLSIYLHLSFLPRFSLLQPSPTLSG